MLTFCLGWKRLLLADTPRQTINALTLYAIYLTKKSDPRPWYFIQKYFDEISQDTSKYCFGVEDTLKALELGAVETLIVWENLDITRYVLRNAAGGKLKIILYLDILN